MIFEQLRTPPILSNLIEFAQAQKTLEGKLAYSNRYGTPYTQQRSKWARTML